MSEFEYASVVVSIVLALGIAEILRFLADTLREPGARQLYWVHLLWMVVLLELHMEFWWRMWAFKDQLTVGPELAVVLVGPALLFMATRTLLPGPQDSADMQQLYYRRKSAFFTMLVTTSLWSMVTSPWSLPEDQRAALYASLVLTVVVIGVFVSCIFTSSRRVHAAVVLVVFGLEFVERASWILRS
jgi:hypothetical protein